MKPQLILLLIGVAVTTAQMNLEVNIADQLEHFSAQRFPNDRYRVEHQKARDHIKSTFEMHGLRVQEQTFNTTVNTDIISINPKDEHVLGVNLIAVASATSNIPESVIVVGADYDSNGIENPLFKNGGGMAVFLETVRLFMYNVRWSQAFAQNFTTVFVAFDLNTKKHEVAAGKPGSWYFVNEWLWPFLNQSSTNFGGAYIIDSVMNVNLEEKSQQASDEFKQMFPTTYTHLTENQFKGDFLSMITLNQEKCFKLRDQYSGKYNRDRMKRPYHLEDMTLPKSLPMNKLLASFTRQASFHFWAFQKNEVAMPLPALLLSDTESHRSVPANSGCEKACPMRMQLTEVREQFMVSTTQALVQTLLGRQATPLPAKAGVTNSIPSFFMSIVMFFMVYVLH